MRDDEQEKKAVLKMRGWGGGRSRRECMYLVSP